MMRGVDVQAGRGRIRRAGVAAALALAACLGPVAARAAGDEVDGSVTAVAAGDGADGSAAITGRVGQEVGLSLAPDGSVRDVSTVPARIVRERRGDVTIVTVV